MSEIERANTLYWHMVYIIEPALCGQVPRFDEPIEEKSRRLAMEMLAKGKAKAILSEMREIEFLNADFIPSVDAP